MGELQAVRAGKAEKGADRRDLPEMPADGADDAAQPAARHEQADNLTPSHARQIWCAYPSDFTDVVLFGLEIKALRYAAANGMRCKAVDLGRSVMDQIRAGLE